MTLGIKYWGPVVPLLAIGYVAPTFFRQPDRTPPCTELRIDAGTLEVRVDDLTTTSCNRTTVTQRGKIQIKTTATYPRRNNRERYSDISEISVRIDGTKNEPVEIDVDPPAPIYRSKLSIPLPYGPHQVSVYAADTAGYGAYAMLNIFSYGNEIVPHSIIDGDHHEPEINNLRPYVSSQNTVYWDGAVYDRGSGLRRVTVKEKDQEVASVVFDPFTWRSELDGLLPSGPIDRLRKYILVACDNNENCTTRTVSVRPHRFGGRAIGGG